MVSQSQQEGSAGLQEENQALQMELEKVYEIISFQLGSPLNTLQALSDMLMKTADSMNKEQVMEFNEHLNTQIGKVQNLLGNMIQWADLQVNNFEFKPEFVELTDIIEEAYAEQESQALLKRQDYQLAITGELKAWADAQMLKRVVGNLLSNAIKFTRVEGRVKLLASAKDGKVVVQIIDEGIGMGPAKLKKLFDPGRKSTQRGTANEQGLGMGLIVAKHLLSLHQAELNLESARGKGTVASFVLSAQAPSKQWLPFST